MNHSTEVAQGERFEFGANWKRFLGVLDDVRVHEAETSLKHMLGVGSLEDRRFIDIGSGSGLFSLAAHRLGATVHSFDYDDQSVACTRELKRRYAPDSAAWHIESGSVLDTPYLRSLGQFDVVYSWGVLHHTGRMWEALANVESLVSPGGRLFIAIYNDQGGPTRRWKTLKALYNRHRVLRPLLIGYTLVKAWWMAIVKGHAEGNAASQLESLRADEPRHVPVARRGRLDRRLSIRSRQAGGDLRFLPLEGLQARPVAHLHGRVRMQRVRLHAGRPVNRAARRQRPRNA